MAGYVASKVRAVKDRLLGLWQHARTRRSSSADDLHQSPLEGGVGEGNEERAHSALRFPAAPGADPHGVERGLQSLVLGGRDVTKRQSNNWQDHRDELEITGFLDRLPPDPLLAEECRPPVNGLAASPVAPSGGRS